MLWGLALSGVLAAVVLSVAFPEEMTRCWTALCRLVENMFQATVERTTALMAQIRGWIGDDTPRLSYALLGAALIAIAALSVMAMRQLILEALPFIFDDPPRALALSLPFFGPLIAALAHVFKVRSLRMCALSVGVLVLCLLASLAYLQKQAVFVDMGEAEAADRVEPLIAAVIVFTVGLCEFFAVYGALHLLLPGGTGYVGVLFIGLLGALCEVSRWMLRAGVAQVLLDIGVKTITMLNQLSGTPLRIHHWKTGMTKIKMSTEIDCAHLRSDYNQVVHDHTIVSGKQRNEETLQRLRHQAERSNAHNIHRMNIKTVWAIAKIMGSYAIRIARKEGRNDASGDYQTVRHLVSQMLKEIRDRMVGPPSGSAGNGRAHMIGEIYDEIKK